MSRLIDQSLVTYDPGADRYAMHEMLRQFAAGKFELDDTLQAETRERHAIYYLNWFTQQSAGLYGFQQTQAMAAIRPESANVLAAWMWAVENRAWSLIAPALDGYAQFLELDGRYRDGHESLRHFIEQLRDDRASSDPEIASLLARALVWRGVFEQWLGRSDLTASSIASALELLDSPLLAERDMRATRALALLNSGVGRFTMLEQESVDAYHDSLAIFRALDDRWNEARALAMLGRVAWSQGDFELANRHYRESLALQREIGDEREIVGLLVLMSSAARYQGNFPEALGLSREIIERARRSGDQVGIGLGISSLGATHYFLGDFEQARESLLEARELLERTGALLDRVAADMRLGFATAALGMDEEARRWYETSRDHYLAGGMSGTAAYLEANLAALDLANDLVEVARSRLESAAEVLRVVQRPAAYSYVLSMLAIVYSRQGKSGEAVEACREALNVAFKHSSQLLLVRAMLALPVVMDHLGRRGERDAALVLLSREPWLVRDRTVERVLRVPLPPESHSPLEPASDRLLRLQREAQRQLAVLSDEVQTHQVQSPE